MVITDASKRRDTADKLIGLLDEHQIILQAVLTAHDPLSPVFTTAAWQAVNATAAKLWPALCEGLSEAFADRGSTATGVGEPDDRSAQLDRYALQQAWAACWRNRVSIGLLYRAGLSQPSTQAEALRLRNLTLERWAKEPGAQGDPRWRSLVDFLMAERPDAAGVPNLGTNTRLRGSIRLRYCLAYHYRNGASLAHLMYQAARQPGASQYQRRVELMRAVKTAEIEGRNWRRLGVTDFSLLSQAARVLLLESPEIWPVLLARSLHEDGGFEARAQALVLERKRLDKVLMDLMRAIRARRLGEVDALLAQIPDTPVAKALCRDLPQQPWELQDVQSHASMRADFGPWVPMSAAALKRLEPFAPHHLPAWWAMTPSEVAAAVCRGELTPGQDPSTLRAKITRQDLAPMQRAWSLEEQLRLIASGAGNLLPSECEAWKQMPLEQVVPALETMGYAGWGMLAKRLRSLPDARPWIELMAQATKASGGSLERACELRELAQRAIEMNWRDRWEYGWGRWVVAAWGCPGWDVVEEVALEHTTPLKDAVALFSSSRMPLVPGAFQEVLARSLHREGSLPKRALEGIKLWLLRDPLAARALVQHAPVDWLERLARNASTPLQTIDVLMGSSHAKVQSLAWRNRMNRTKDAQELKTLATHMPPGLGKVRSLSRWLGEEEERPVALVLACRRSTDRLAELSRRLGQDAFIQACAQAQSALTAKADATKDSRARREAAMLEFIPALGLDFVDLMHQVMALADPKALAGHKLDHAYQEAQIPKRSGGMRTILMPRLVVKDAQRMVLDKLVQPLGAHDAACGFIPDRSIVDNAKPHVGQPVVVNADISNCFPSVRWSLVLAALRRELGDRLSPTAISLLVDLCTARGALPVGSPASPALLNLVLRRTDEVLQAAAENIGAKYTRYADDLTFSGDRRVVGLLRTAQRTLGQIGLVLDPKKTNIFRRGRRQMVTGLVVNEQVAVPREVRRQMRAAVHRVEQGVSLEDGQTVEQLKGRLAFLSMVHEPHARTIRARLDAALAKGADHAV
jgi:retron-type reverse transcriptase